MTVVRCIRCGSEVPGGFERPAEACYCTVDCATRAGASDRVLRYLREQEAQPQG